MTIRPFSTLTAKEKGIELLRWIGVLPAAKLGDFAGYYVGGALGLLTQSLGMVNPPSDDSAHNRLLRYLIWLFPVGVAVVLAAAKMAPRYRLVTASVVAILWILWTSRIHGFGGPTLVAAPVAAGCGLALLVYSELKRRRQTP